MKQIACVVESHCDLDDEDDVIADRAFCQDGRKMIFTIITPYIKEQRR
jgi:hypothetical protein